MGDKRAESLLLSAKESAKLLGVCASHFHGLNNSGRLGPLPIRLGRRALWSRKELEAWIAHECPARRQWQEMKKIGFKAKSA
jgi:predicted DNA-binding transcriptional regulator AlpA